MAPGRSLGGFQPRPASHGIPSRPSASNTGIAQANLPVPYPPPGHLLSPSPSQSSHPRLPNLTWCPAPWPAQHTSMLDTQHPPTLWPGLLNICGKNRQHPHLCPVLSLVRVVRKVIHCNNKSSSWHQIFPGPYHRAAVLAKVRTTPYQRQNQGHAMRLSPGNKPVGKEGTRCIARDSNVPVQHSSPGEQIHSTPPKSLQSPVSAVASNQEKDQDQRPRTFPLNL